MATKLVVFDLHGVLLSAVPGGHQKFRERLEATDQQWTIIQDKFLTGHDSWSRLERGEYSLDHWAESFVAFCSEIGVICNRELAKTIWGDPSPFEGSTLYENLFAYLFALKLKGISVALATNNIAEWRPIWTELLTDTAIFDFIVDSSEIGARKPERAFYAAVEEQATCDVSEILFVDDRAENIRAAKEFGWSGLHFQTEAETMAQMQGLNSKHHSAININRNSDRSSDLNPGQPRRT